jgi:hypothetical protein
MVLQLHQEPPAWATKGVHPGSVATAAISRNNEPAASNPTIIPSIIPAFFFMADLKYNLLHPGVNPVSAGF